MLACVDMLSAHAYTFRQKSRLAISLSWVAGYTNVIVLIAAGQTISHQTGNTTHFGNGLGEALLGQPGALADVLLFGFVILCFLLGAMASGFMTEGARRAGRNSRYVIPMTVEAMLLSALVLLMLRYPALSTAYQRDRVPMLWVSGIAAFAMGLQNATITRISGAVVRTTHLTGVVTDLGLELVQLWHWWIDKLHAPAPGRRFVRLLRISRRHQTAQRVFLLASIFGSFLFGATAGTVIFSKLGPRALLAPVLFLSSIVLMGFFTPTAEIHEIDPAKDGELGLIYQQLQMILPSVVGIFRLTHRRADRRHRAPDFAGWVDRLPRRWRVVILVINPMTQFDTDSAASLLSAIQTLKSHGRTMVISGMNRIQFKTLVDCGLTKAIEMENFVPDLEFAVARAINVATAG